MTSTPIQDHRPRRRISDGQAARERWVTRSRPRRCVLIALAIAAVNVALLLWLLALGRDFGPAGSLQAFWNGGLGAGENSRHFTDWYSLLHVIFGMGLFVAIDRMKPRWPLSWKLFAAICGSASWEAIENTPLVIALFTDAGTPGAYAGDSIVNSLGDMLSVALGFAYAASVPLWATIALAVALELTVSLAIHDGLILGTLRLFGFPY